MFHTHKYNKKINTSFIVSFSRAILFEINRDTFIDNSELFRFPTDGRDETRRIAFESSCCRFYCVSSVVCSFRCSSFISDSLAMFSHPSSMSIQLQHEFQPLISLCVSNKKGSRFSAVWLQNLCLYSQLSDIHSSDLINR